MKYNKVRWILNEENLYKKIPQVYVIDFGLLVQFIWDFKKNKRKRHFKNKIKQKLQMFLKLSQHPTLMSRILKLSSNFLLLPLK